MAIDLTVDQAWELFEKHLSEEQTMPYEALTTSFSNLLRQNPRVKNSVPIGKYILETSDCFHILAARVVGLSDWFNYAVINTWDSNLSWMPDKIDFEGLDGEKYVLDIEELSLYKRLA
jgi:hypothetical protein